MQANQRQALIVWVYSLKQLKTLRKYGTVSYISKQMKYVYLYVNQDDVEQTLKDVQRLHFVRSVEISHRPELRMDFSEILPELRQEIEEEKEAKKNR